MCCWRESYEVFWAILLRPVMTFKNGFLDVMRSMNHSLMFRIIQKIKDSYFASSHLLWQSLDQWNYKVLLLMGWSTVFCADCTFQGQRFTSLGGMGHCRWSELKLCPGFLSLPDLLSRACMINKSPNEERAPWKCLENTVYSLIFLYQKEPSYSAWSKMCRWYACANLHIKSNQKGHFPNSFLARILYSFIIKVYAAVQLMLLNA